MEEVTIFQSNSGQESKLAYFPKFSFDPFGIYFSVAALKLISASADTTQSHGISCYSHEINLIYWFMFTNTILAFFFFFKAMYFYW